MAFLGYTNGTKGFHFMQSPNNVIFQSTTALFDECMFPHCLDTMDQGHTHVDKYNLPEENILPEDGDGPQDVPDLWVPPSVPNQEGPNDHQPPYKMLHPLILLLTILVRV